MKKLTVWIFLSCFLQKIDAQISRIDKLMDIPKATIKDTTIRLNSRDNNTVDIPITYIHGAEKGPTFTVIAGIHGMEYPTILSLLELRKEIDPQRLKGNMIIIPIVNIPSFFQRRAFVNPMDSLNLNRVFPGDPKGSITEVMADFLSREIFSATDILLDMHGGDVGEDLMPFMCYYENKEFETQTKRAQRLCEISGINSIVSYPYTLPPDKPAMFAFKQAVRQGIVAFSMEIGKLGNWKKGEIVVAKEAIYRTMAHLQMYKDKQLDPLYLPLQYYHKQAYLSVPVQGIFHSELIAGDQVQKGMEIGYITDVFGNILHRIHSPESGVILYKVGTPPVNAGETLLCIGF